MYSYAEEGGRGHRVMRRMKQVEHSRYNSNMDGRGLLMILPFISYTGKSPSIEKKTIKCRRGDTLTQPNPPESHLFFEKLTCEDALLLFLLLSTQKHVKSPGNSFSDRATTTFLPRKINSVPFKFEFRIFFNLFSGKPE